GPRGPERASVAPGSGVEEPKKRRHVGPLRRELHAVDAHAAERAQPLRAALARRPREALAHRRIGGVGVSDATTLGILERDERDRGEPGLRAGGPDAGGEDDVAPGAHEGSDLVTR